MFQRNCSFSWTTDFIRQDIFAKDEWETWFVQTKKAESSFQIDAAKLWNYCPNAIKMSNTLNTAKIEILK